MKLFLIILSWKKDHPIEHFSISFFVAAAEMKSATILCRQQFLAEHGISGDVSAAFLCADCEYHGTEPGILNFQTL